MSLVLKNGVVVGSANINVIIGGVIVTGIKSIDFMVTQKKENVAAFQAQPVGRGRGAYDYGEGKMEILLEEYKAIVAAAANRDIRQIPMFSIPISYTDNTGLTVMQSEMLNNCEFTGNTHSYKAGDTAEWISLSFIYAGINQ